MARWPEVVREAQQAIERHAWAHPDHPVGGVLIGRVHDSARTIEDVVPSPEDRTHSGEVAFPDVIWDLVYERLTGGAKVLGWYHSHPGRGTELSDYDRRLHSLLFPDPVTVALVLDPVSGERRWYGWVLRDLAGGAARGDGAPSARRPLATPARGTAAALALAVALTAGGFGGWWIGTHPGPAVPHGVERRLSTERARAERLRALLEQADRELAAERAAARRVQGRLRQARRELAAARAAVARARHTVTYVVRPGDSLWGLARSFYGTGEAWGRIWRANRDRLADPNVLLPGQPLRIVVPSR